MPTHKVATRNANESFVSYLQVFSAGMDLHKMIAELQAERQRLDQAIEALERLNTKSLPRRGRPPAWLKKSLEELETSGAHSETENARSAKA